MQWRDLPKLLHLRDGEIAHADRADLPLLIEREHRFSRLPERHLRIGPMNLVDVDVVGTQASQRVFHFLQDALARCVAKYLAVTPLDADLGGNDCIGTRTRFRYSASDDVLGYAEAVGGRGIDQCDPLIQRSENGVGGFPFVSAAPHPAAHGPGAERDARHSQACAGNRDELDVERVTASL